MCGEYWWPLGRAGIQKECKYFPTGSIDLPIMTYDQVLENTGIDKDCLNRECSDKHLWKIASLLPAAEWMIFANALRLSEEQIQDIILQKQHVSSCVVMAHKVLEKWHRQHAFDATYHHLVEVCLKLRYVSAAVEICKLVKGQQFPCKLIQIRLYAVYKLMGGFKPYTLVLVKAELHFCYIKRRSVQDYNIYISHRRSPITRLPETTSHCSWWEETGGGQRKRKRWGHYLPVLKTKLQVTMIPAKDKYAYSTSVQQAHRINSRLGVIFIVAVW